MEAIVLRCHTATYPFFTIQDCTQFFNGVLDGNPFAIMATYEPAHTEWQYHEVSTVREVDPSGVILYCALPSGIAGGRIQNCPGLQEAITLLHSKQPNTLIFGSMSFDQPIPQMAVIPQHRRWPATYSYAEIVAGLEQFASLRNGTPAHSPRESFEITFPYSNYIDTTFRRHNKVYMKAKKLGRLMDWGGSWESFVHTFQATTPHNLHVETSIGRVISEGHGSDEGSSWQGSDLNWESSIGLFTGL